MAPKSPLWSWSLSRHSLIVNLYLMSGFLLPMCLDNLGVIPEVPVRGVFDILVAVKVWASYLQEVAQGKTEAKVELWWPRSHFKRIYGAILSVFRWKDLLKTMRKKCLHFPHMKEVLTVSEQLKCLNTNKGLWYTSLKNKKCIKRHHAHTKTYLYDDYCL